jgi:DNA-binding IclR family transcriptional regulator
MGVRAIAQQLQLPLGSVHRLLHDLAEEGIVDRTPGGEWELSFRLLEITGLQLERIELPRLARPFAEKIAAATRETVNINALSGHYGVCVDKVRGNEGMQLDLRIGSRGPLYCGGAGKAMLAFMDAAEQEATLAAPLTALTANTVTDPVRLRKELGRIRERGYSIDDQEVVMGVYCVAVPILDRQGRAVGAISVTGSSPKQPGPEILPVVSMLWEATGHVSRRLGYGGEWPPLAHDAVRSRQMAGGEA